MNPEDEEIRIPENRVKRMKRETRLGMQPNSRARAREAALGEVVSTPLDNRAGGSGIPLHGRQAFARGDRKGRQESLFPGRAAIWAVNEMCPVDVPIWGKYPKGFLEWVAPQLRATPCEILHLCSGGLEPSDGGIRVDLRLEVRPDVVADVRKLPFPSDHFHAVLIDPPYSVEYAEGLYGTEYPRPSHLLAEAVRVAHPGSRIGIVHFLIPYPPKGAKYLGCAAITAGCGYRVRALTIFEKVKSTLFG